jgi:hypothetical protein
MTVASIWKHSGAMAADKRRLEITLRWMEFDEVSSYMIAERRGAHLRQFWGVGDDLLARSNALLLWSKAANGGAP